MQYGLLLACTLILVRFLALRVVPFRIVSTDTAVFVGVFLYFVLPLAAVPDRMATEWPEYVFHIVGAYAAFLIGSWVGLRFASTRLHRWGRSGPAVGSQGHLYPSICVLLTAYLGWRVWEAGGLVQLIQNWTYGDIHRATLDMTEVLEKDASMAALGGTVLQIAFVLLWTVVFLKNRMLGCLVWTVYVLATLTEYVGRSAIFSLLIVPYIVYARVGKLRPRTIWLHGVLLVVAGLVFGSWMSYFRLGARYEFSTDRVIEDAVRDAGGPMTVATIVLKDPAYRGSAARYLMSYFSFIVPRVLWPDKPGNELNSTLTRLLTGRFISRNNSVNTFTILGEGWFYFGAAGGILLMFVFGLMSTVVGCILSRSSFFAGAYALVVMQTLFQLRSTLLYYTQYCLLLVIVGYALFRVAKRRAQARVTSPGRREVCRAAGF